jgi:N-glycosylase/DNA lyase
VFQIQQTTRRCHQDIDAAAQLHHLRVNAHAAENHQRANVQIFAVITHVLADLRRQFARWRQDQRTHRTTAFRVRLFFTRRCSSGSVKPAVLPVPVWALAIRSRP